MPIFLANEGGDPNSQVPDLRFFSPKT